MTILEITDEQQLKDTLDKRDGRVVVLWTAPAWCVPCQKFEPQFEEAAELSDIPFVRVDIDNNPWSSHYGIRAVPTIMLFPADKEDNIEFVRPASAAAFAQSIQE